MLNCAVGLLKFIYMYANFRAIDSELFLYLVCFLNMDVGWVKNKLNWSCRVTWKPTCQMKNQFLCYLQPAQLLALPLCLIISHSWCSTCWLLCICQGWHGLTAAWAVAMQKERWKESSGRLFIPAWVFGGRHLFQETETPGTVLKQEQRPGHDQGQSPAPGSWIPVFSPYLQFCSPWAAVSFALQCLVQAPWRDACTCEKKRTAGLHFCSQDPILCFSFAHWFASGLFLAWQHLQAGDITNKF